MSTAISTGVLAVGVTTPFAGVTYLNAIQAFTDGTNAVTVNIYNNTTNSGTIMAKLVVVGASLSGTVGFSHPARFDIGMTVEVIGTGGTAIVHWGAAK